MSVVRLAQMRNDSVGAGEVIVGKIGTRRGYHLQARALRCGHPALEDVKHLLTHLAQSVQQV
jgi:hypothetical protein